jgi:hypothetical protein
MALYKEKYKSNPNQPNPGKSSMSLATQSQYHAQFDNSNGQASSNDYRQKSMNCRFCDSSTHRLYACNGFMEKPWPERHEFVRSNRLCFGCLIFGHPANQCRRRHTCGICKKTHPTCLHQDITSEEKQNDETQTNVSHAVGNVGHANPEIKTIGSSINFSTSIVPVWLSAKENPSHEVLVYALLDSMSDTNFVLDDVYEQIGSDYEKTTLKIGTMTSRNTTIPCKKALDLQMCSYYDKSKFVTLPTAYTREFIPANASNIPSPDKVAKWPHLLPIVSQIPSVQVCPVGLLVGFKCLQAFLPRKTIIGKNDEPFAIKTDLGWSIMGPEYDHKTKTDCDNIGITHFVMTLPVNENIDVIENPADVASRECKVADLNQRWFSGPELLYDPNLDIKLCEPAEKVMLADSDPEVKRVVNAVTTEKESTPFGLHDRLEDILGWDKMLKFVQVFKRRAVSLANDDQALDPIVLKQKCQQYIVMEIQREAFCEEIKLLESGKEGQLPKSSRLYGLNPFVDNEGILSVGGRCAKARWELREKHPVILPRVSHVTNAIVRHYHVCSAHQGRSMTANSVRSHGFWIIGLNRVVSSVIHYCVTCRKERGAFGVQKMADLPPQRVEETPPFTSVGCDCFGPFFVHENRKQLKKYGVVYTCLYSRAIHVEDLDDMSTDSFINSFRCVTAIRGNIRKLFCDRGTNFVGASTALKEAWNEIVNPETAALLAKLDCEFVFNPPTASHMGGVWERQIRTIHSILTNFLNKQPGRVTSSEIRTQFYETMAIVNSRPLSVENLYDSQAPRPLTPNHLLTMKSEVIISPPGEFSGADLYSRKRWRKVQFLANEFWKEWKRQYISNIQRRSKWNQEIPNIKVDSVVVISDVNSPRNMWKLGRVVETFESQDGLVRKVRLFTGVVAGGPQYVERPVHKLVVLLD